MILLLLFCLVGLATALSVTDVPSCAIPCLMQMFDSSNGTNPDIRSMCDNQSSLPTQMMSCVTSRCNIEDLRVLMTFGAEFCSTPLQDNRQEYRIVIIVFTTLAMFFVALRVASKFITKIAWGPDDTWAVIAFVFLIPLTVFVLLAIQHGIGLALPLFSQANMKKAIREIVIVHSLYLCGLTAAKNSILFFYLRVFPDNRFRIVVWVTIAFNIISTIVISILNFTVGGAIGNLLSVKHLGTLDPKDYLPSIRVVLISCSINLVVDVWMLLLPMTQLYNIGLKLNKKLSVMSMFGLGLFLTVVSLVRTVLTAQLLVSPSEAATGQVQVVLWALIETYVGTIVACVPSMRQLARKMICKRKEKEGGPKPIFIDRSLARIEDGEETPTLSDVGGLTTMTGTLSSGTTAVANGMDHEMVVTTKAKK